MDIIMQLCQNTQQTHFTGEMGRGGKDLAIEVTEEKKHFVLSCSKH